MRKGEEKRGVERDKGEEGWGLKVLTLWERRGPISSSVRFSQSLVTHSLIIIRE